MKIRGTRIFEDNLAAFCQGQRRSLNEGGTYSSKTWSVLQALILIAAEAKTRLIISVVSESLPHLKRGAIRDFFNILGESSDNNSRYNKTEQTYSLGESIIEFFGADESDKVRGPRRDILFLNEANNIPWETARGLDIRTRLFTFADWNPVSEFWAHEYWLPDHAKSEADREERLKSNTYIHSTYLDAKKVLPREVVANIEAQRDKDANWWNIYGLGLIGKIEGLVHPDFEQVDSLPLGEYFYGLDYGFSADPTVIVKNVVLGDKLYSQELLYDYSGLTNDQIARKFALLGVKNEPIYPDPDEPKSAEELRRLGLNVKDSVKGKGSVEFGIQMVNQHYQHWTKDSVNCIKDQRNYRFIRDKNTGEFTDKTTHNWSHGMDARRYPVASHRFSRGKPVSSTQARSR